MIGKSRVNLASPAPHTAVKGVDPPRREVMQLSLQEPVFKVAGRFLQRRWLLILGISGAVLIPCFWHKHIEAGDLGSHVYNAWLAELVHRGALSGLWIHPQWNNVAFDLVLSAFAKIVNWAWAEKLAVSLCVLIFFWGVLALVSAAARRAPLFLTPLIAVISYGWTFEQGFINYHLALGLSFFALAILWRGNAKERLAVILLVPLIFMAHPLGLVWLAGAGAYAIASERFQLHRVWVFAVATLLVLSINIYVRYHYVAYPLQNHLISTMEQIRSSFTAARINSSLPQFFYLSWLLWQTRLATSERPGNPRHRWHASSALSDLAIFAVPAARWCALARIQRSAYVPAGPPYDSFCGDHLWAVGLDQTAQVARVRLRDAGPVVLLPSGSRYGNHK
jgi:hypothetical protein